MKIENIIIAATGITVAATPQICASEAQLPNIIYILVDDLGYVTDKSWEERTRGYIPNR